MGRSLNDTLNGLEVALTDLAEEVLLSPPSSPARDQAVSLYRERSGEALSILAGARPGFEDPLPGLLAAQDLGRRVRGSQR